MKKIVTSIVFFTSSLFANHQYITLAAGSTATIYSNQETTVACQGTSNTPRQHCKCVASAYKMYGISLDELGLITAPSTWGSIESCNTYILTEFKARCFY